MARDLIEKGKQLRSKAEKLIEKMPERFDQHYTAKYEELIHELKVHQVELEMQNENMRHIYKELESVKTEFFDLYDNAPVGYLTSTPFGIIRRANQTIANLLGVDIASLIGTNLQQWCLTDDAFYLHCRALVGQGSRLVETLRMKSPDGSEFFALLDSTLIISSDGKGPDEIRTVISDITTLHNLESQLRQKNKMEAMGYMAGGIAHNFNNNLSVILGNVELAQSELEQINLENNNDVLFFLENAKTAVFRSRDLVQKILTYSCKAMQSKAPMPLSGIIDETVRLLESTLPSTINLQKIYSSDSDTKLVNADPSQVQEILLNLCNNAVHAMDEKGDLILRLDFIELEGKNIPVQYDCPSGHYAKITVQDSGCGIAPELLEKIFDPFFSTKEAFEGTGLGLSTVQGIVAQHGGIIKVDSHVNKGTTVEIFFPFLEGYYNEEELVAENPVFTGGTEHILYVDDDPVLAALGKRMLEKGGYSVLTMTSSQEALKLFDSKAALIDLVITDQTMPEMTGIELIAEIKQIRPDIPVIVCTGYSSKINEELAQDLGISSFIMKPIALSQLLKVTRQALDGENQQLA
jgi:PAS domain S-box-containing protein